MITKQGKNLLSQMANDPDHGIDEKSPRIANVLFGSAGTGATAGALSSQLAPKHTTKAIGSGAALGALISGTNLRDYRVSDVKQGLKNIFSNSDSRNPHNKDKKSYIKQRLYE